MNNIPGKNSISIRIREGQKEENTAFQIWMETGRYNIEEGPWLLLEKKTNTNRISKRLKFGRLSFWLHGKLQEGAAMEGTRSQHRKGIGDVAYDLFGTILNQVQYRLWISARNKGDIQKFRQQANWLKSIIQRRDEVTRSSRASV